MINKIKKALSTRWNMLRARMGNIRHVTNCYDLIVLDDLFPHLTTAFRVAEYSEYLTHFSNVVLFSSAASFAYINEPRNLSAIIAEYTNYHPKLAGKVLQFHPGRKLRARLAYVMFLHNACDFLDVLEKNKLPFIFQLYPGGTFQLNDSESDRKLAKVCGSPYLRHVIVTQLVTYNYLIDKGFCRIAQVTLIYGVVVPLQKLLTSLPARLEYKVSKLTLDICFVAGKYMPAGKDKGYDIFIAAAGKLAQQFSDLRIHVVGPYNDGDVPAPGLAGIITFYGTQPTHFFPAFYARMDAIVSPNQSFVLNEGAFDGFPTASCVEAGACGVALFCTDDLGQNIAFQDKHDIVLIQADADDVAEKVGHYLGQYDQLVALGLRVQQIIKHVFTADVQIKKRIEIIENNLSLVVG